jgi:hypothetical protein
MCDLCYDDNINYCVTCKYDYSFNNEEKNCHPYQPQMTESVSFSDFEFLIPSSLNKTDIINEHETYINNTLLNTDISSILKTSLASFEESLIKSDNISIPENLKNSILTTILKAENTSILEAKDTSIDKILNTSSLESLKSEISSILEATDSSIDKDVNYNTLESLKQTDDISQMMSISSPINTIMQNSTQISSSALNTLTDKYT